MSDTHIPAPPRYTTYVPLTDLAPSDGNPKRHELERIIEAITSHGFIDQPIADERTGRIISGHGRRESLIEMQARGTPLPRGLILDEDGGWLVPVQRGWSSRDDYEAQAVIIKLNRIPEAGGWDSRALATYLEDLATGDAELFDSLAYSDDEMDTLLARVDPETLPGATEHPPPMLRLVEDTDDADDEEPTAAARTCPTCGHTTAPGC